MSYSTSLGRFLERDPIGYVDGLNLYEYERSNPVNTLDSSGLLSIEDVIATVKDGKQSACEAFVQYIESLSLNPNGTEAAFWYFQPKESYEGIGKEQNAALSGVPKDKLGIGFDAFKGLPSYGFHSNIEPNQHYNFAHFSGIFFARDTGFLLKQIDEDMRQYEANDHTRAERCAEIIIDLTTLKYIDFVAEVAADAVREVERTDAWNRHGEVYTNLMRQRLPQFGLGNRICNRETSTCPSCGDAYKELKEYRQKIARKLRR